MYCICSANCYRIDKTHGLHLSLCSADCHKIDIAAVILSFLATPGGTRLCPSWFKGQLVTRMCVTRGNMQFKARKEGRIELQSGSIHPST